MGRRLQGASIRLRRKRFAKLETSSALVQLLAARKEVDTSEKVPVVGSFCHKELMKPTRPEGRGFASRAYAPGKEADHC